MVSMKKFWAKSKIKRPENIKDILPALREDRRFLSKVPDSSGSRSNLDRRRIESDFGDYEDFKKLSDNEDAGKRYVVNYTVLVQYSSSDGEKSSCLVKSKDISGTGILLNLFEEEATKLKDSSQIKLKFTILPGTMPEGYEMKVNIGAKIIRKMQKADGSYFIGMEFTETLAQYAARNRYRYMLTASSLFLLMIVGFIILMRSESIIYFKFNKMLYLYSIIASTFLLTRYFFGTFYRSTPINPKFTPGVTIIVPCFNEEQWIQRTILGCVNQDYPTDKLEIIVVDDCSNDKSVEKIKEIIEQLKQTEKRYDMDRRIHYLVQEKNAGKRDALAAGVKIAQHELVVFVDSDSMLDPFAIRNIVQPFCDNRMGGVSGRTDVANTYTNTLTKMQAVRYYISFRIMKAAEGYFDAVTCLSGPLSCYRKDLLMKYMDKWLNQKFLRQRATFGDDRSMTNFILRHHRTGYQDTAVCRTIVPNTHNMFLKQQMRWKRSWLRESLIASRFMWKKEPFMALSFYMGVLVPILAPVIVLYNLIYIPFAHRVFPTAFIVGMFLMALLMSMAQLFLRKSSTWVFGIWFCLYYEAVLLWQMPIAWFTFWKSTWGTRMTPADVAELNKKMQAKKTRAEI